MFDRYRILEPVGTSDLDVTWEVTHDRILTFDKAFDICESDCHSHSRIEVRDSYGNWIEA